MDKMKNKRILMNFLLILGLMMGKIHVSGTPILKEEKMKKEEHNLPVVITRVKVPYPIIIINEGESNLFTGDCVPYVLYNNCVEISIEEEFPGVEKEFIYEWNFGDGKVTEGKTVEKCYDKPGSYQLSMSLRDKVTGIRLDREWTREIVIDDVVTPHIKGPSRVTLGEISQYEFDINLPEKYKVSKSYWSANDLQTQGPTFDITFDKLGKQTLELEVVIQNESDEVKLCVTSTVLVEDFNVDGQWIGDIFKKAEPGNFETGPYLKDALHMGLIESSTGLWREFVLHPKRHSIRVEGNKKYKMIFWKGNQFTDFLSLELSGLSDSLAFRKLGATVLELEKREIYNLSSFTFTLDSKEETEDLTNVINMLKKFPFLKIGIGVHTHHKGSREKVIDLSERRTSVLVSELLGQGIEASVVKGYSPREEVTLLNNCTGVVHCDGVNEKLSRRADFKVTAINFKQHFFQQNKSDI